MHNRGNLSRAHSMVIESAYDSSEFWVPTERGKMTKSARTATATATNHSICPFESDSNNLSICYVTSAEEIAFSSVDVRSLISKLPLKQFQSIRSFPFKSSKIIIPVTVSCSLSKSDSIHFNSSTSSLARSSPS